MLFAIVAAVVSYAVVAPAERKSKMAEPIGATLGSEGTTIFPSKGDDCPTTQRGTPRGGLRAPNVSNLFQLLNLAITTCKSP